MLINDDFKRGYLVTLHAYLPFYSASEFYIMLLHHCLSMEITVI